MLGKSPYDILPAPENSLEEICHRTGYEMLFIYLQGIISDKAHWLNQKMKSPASRAFGDGCCVASASRCHDVYRYGDTQHKDSKRGLIENSLCPFQKNVRVYRNSPK